MTLLFNFLVYLVIAIPTFSLALRVNGADVDSIWRTAWVVLIGYVGIDLAFHLADLAFPTN